MKICTGIRMARARSGLSQREVAKRVGISTAFLSMLENDRRDPSWSTICKIAEATGIGVILLVGFAAEAAEASAAR